MAKPKGCTWTQDGEFWDIECEDGASVQMPCYPFCPFCGRETVPVREDDDNG